MQVRTRVRADLMAELDEVIAVARPVSAIVNAQPSIVRDHRVFVRPGLAETRVLNPEIADRLGGFIRPFPFPMPTEQPGCPAGGEHDFAASANYTLVINRAGAEGQSNWRWCRKCQGLAFGGHAGMGGAPRAARTISA